MKKIQFKIKFKRYGVVYRPLYARNQEQAFKLIEEKFSDSLLTPDTAMLYSRSYQGDLRVGRAWLSDKAWQLILTVPRLHREQSIVDYSI